MLIASFVDWDAVGAVPLKLSAVSIAQSFFGWGEKLKLDNDLDVFFQQELSRIEQEKSCSREWSQMFCQSEENHFIATILRWGFELPKLEQLYPELLRKALYRSPERIARAASEWKIFIYEFYLNKGLPVPDFPVYMEIQEALRKYRESRFKRILRTVQICLMGFFEKLGSWFYNGRSSREGREKVTELNLTAHLTTSREDGIGPHTLDKHLYL